MAEHVIQDRVEEAKSHVDLGMEPLPGYDVVDTKKDYHDEESALIEEMVYRVNNGRDWWRRNFEAARADVEFTYNEQWPQEAKDDREGRPALTFNLLPQYVNQVMGSVRQSKFNIHILQTSGPNDKVPIWAGGAQGDMYPPSEVMEGLIRDIERRSKAERAYVRAMQHAVEGGFGWLWVRSVRPPDNPFEVELRIEHIKDRWSVLMDPHAEMDDFADAGWGAVSQRVPRRDFEKRHPDVPATGWSIGDGYDQNYRQWWGGDTHVRVAHYFYKHPEKRTALRLVDKRTGTEIVEYEDNLEKILDELTELGYEEADQKELDTFRVKHIMCTAHNILDGPNDWPGMRVPIVPVVGREINLDGYNHYAGLTRWAYDPQRMFNYFLSSAIERVALSPKAPWLATPEQISGFEAEWKDQHKRNVGVLLYHDTEGVDKPSRQDPATMPTAEMQIVLQTRQAVMETLGMYEASTGQKSNETSGVAIQRRQATSTANTFEFVDNLAFSIASIGDILCDVIPKVYSGDVTRRIIMPDETQARVQLNHEIIDEETGTKHRIANLGLSRYTCAARPGPAFNSVREEFVTMMTEWGRSDPEALMAVRDLIVNNLDVPNARELARRFKMMAPRFLLRPEDAANLPEPPPPQPTPAEQAEMAKAQATEAKAQSDVEIANISLKVEELKLQQEQEQTQQAKLKTQQAGVALETTTEKGAAEIDKAEREPVEAAEPDEGKITNIVRRQVAAAMAEAKKSG